MKFLELFIDCIIMWIAFYSIGKILFNEDKKEIVWKIIITIVIFSILLAILNMRESQLVNGVEKVFLSYMMFCCFYKIVFNKTLSQILVASLILYITVFISEALIAIIISLILKINNYGSISILKNTILINILISSLAYIISFFNRRKLHDFVKNSNFKKAKYLIIILIILLAVSLLGFKIPISKWNFNIEFIVTMLILLLFCVIGIMLIKQNTEIEKTVSMYQKLVEYSNITNKVLEEYRVVTHENKNQLLVIRSMLDNKDKNKELKDYVDNLIEKRKDLKYSWIGELNYLSLPGLKGLINYKLIEMKTQKIEINISVSKEIAKIKLNKLTTKQKDNLYSIIGIFMDNAIQSASKSSKKEISLEIYKEKKNMVFILANTYHGKINLEKLDEYGYTTKGKNHGVGLHIVKRILEEESIFKQNKKLFQNYFVQELYIDINSINK